MHDLTKTLFDLIPDQGIRLVPCMITATSPLTATILGGSIACVGIVGLTYATGPALALMTRGGAPVLIRTV